MAQDNGFRARWRRFMQALDATSGGIEYDRHEHHRRRFAEIDARLASIEQRFGPAAYASGGETSPST